MASECLLHYLRKFECFYSSLEAHINQTHVKHLKYHLNSSLNCSCNLIFQCFATEDVFLTLKMSQFEMTLQTWGQYDEKQTCKVTNILLLPRDTSTAESVCEKGEYFIQIFTSITGGANKMNRSGLRAEGSVAITNPIPRVCSHVTLHISKEINKNLLFNSEFVACHGAFFSSFFLKKIHE